MTPLECSHFRIGLSHSLCTSKYALSNTDLFSKLNGRVIVVGLVNDNHKYAVNEASNKLLIISTN